jgi:dienelactone hydrolase
MPAPREVRIPPGLTGDLTVPRPAAGIVLFAHGSGSSRHSSRNRYVAGILQEAGFATLLLDLLTPEEERVDNVTAQIRFDIGLLAERLVNATDWLRHEPETRTLPVAYFGASTGAGAALVAAAMRPALIDAVVSRGGRPDLAGPALARVRAPVLLIVGGEDEMVVRLNGEALEQLPGEKQLAVVPGASHLFEEPGTLEQAADLAAEWMKSHLAARPPRKGQPAL